MFFNVENHITSGNESIECVERVSDVPSRNFACDRILDFTMCADITDNFAEEFSELSPEDVISDDGITTRTQLIKFLHDEPALSKLFDFI